MLPFDKVKRFTKKKPQIMAETLITSMTKKDSESNITEFDAARILVEDYPMEEIKLFGRFKRRDMPLPTPKKQVSDPFHDINMLLKTPKMVKRPEAVKLDDTPNICLSSEKKEDFLAEMAHQLKSLFNDSDSDYMDVD